MSTSLVTNAGGSGVRLDVTPESANWRFLSFSVVNLAEGTTHDDHRPAQETAIVPLSGSGVVVAGGQTFEIGRTSVFEQMPQIVYVTPGDEMTITASAEFEFAIGSAPAEGLYPTRLIVPEEMKSEVRGGGASQRQVNHVLAPPVDAERLILYEVYVPRGMWSGWAPHRHDGVDGSPYLEETYFFRMDPGNGFAMHRNWAPEDAFDETVVLHDGDTARRCRAPARTCSFSTISLAIWSTRSGRRRRVSTTATRGSMMPGKTETKGRGCSRSCRRRT